MNKLDWYISTSALRQAVAKIRLDGIVQIGQPETFYKFHLVYDSSREIYHLYNLLTNNVVATFKARNDRLIIRYRENSFYSGIIKSLEWDGHTVVKVASSNLSRVGPNGRLRMVTAGGEDSLYWLRRNRDWIGKRVRKTGARVFLRDTRSGRQVAIVHDSWKEGEVAPIEITTQGVADGNDNQSIGIHYVETAYDPAILDTFTQEWTASDVE